MAISLPTMLVAGSALAALLQLPPVPEYRLDVDDLNVIEAALTASAVADLRRGTMTGELLVLDETVVFCSSSHRSQLACMRESVELPSAQRTLVPSILPSLRIAGTRAVAHVAVEDVFRSAEPDTGWSNFHKAFPDAAGFAGVSAPGYDAGDARVYVTFMYGGTGAKGWLVRLIRDGDAWRVSAVTLLWIS